MMFAFSRRMKLVSISSAYLLTATKAMCAPDYHVVEQSGLWQFEVNDGDHSARITTQQDGLRVVLVTLPKEDGIGFGAAIFRHNPRHLTLTVDGLTVRFGQPQQDPNTLGMFTDFDAQITQDMLVPLIHALTIAQVGYFDVDGERLLLSLEGTSAAVNALDKYNQENGLLLPPPFHNAPDQAQHGSPVTEKVGGSDAGKMVASKAIGMSVADVEALYPYVECDASGRGEMCSFNKNQTPQALCPPVGPCDELILFTKAARVVGYSAKFSYDAWMRSLKMQYKIRGNPTQQTFGPSGMIKMKEQDYRWSWPGGGTLTYTSTGGVNIWGAPLDLHTIAIYPEQTSK